MKKLTSAALTAAISAAVAMPAFASGMPNGAHYNLNIIGVEKAKKSKMTGSNRHTIFVPLKTVSKGVKSVKNNIDPENPEAQAPDVTIETQIWLMPGDDFRVCDGNGFDLAYGCDDNPLGEWDTCAYIDENTDPAVEEWVYQCGVISKKEGAVFELPCNENLSPETYIDENGDEQPLEGYIACDDTVLEPVANYEVWAKTGGSPHNASATLTTCATVQDELQCSTENTVQSRTKGNSLWNEVTDELTSAVVEYCTGWDEVGGDSATYDPRDGDLCTEWETTRIALFAGDSEDWFWNYDNNGLRLLQLRFYDIGE